MKNVKAIIERKKRKEIQSRYGRFSENRRQGVKENGIKKSKGK